MTAPGSVYYTNKPKKQAWKPVKAEPGNIYGSEAACVVGDREGKAGKSDRQSFLPMVED